MFHSVFFLVSSSRDPLLAVRAGWGGGQGALALPYARPCDLAEQAYQPVTQSCAATVTSPWSQSSVLGNEMPFSVAYVKASILISRNN